MVQTDDFSGRNVSIETGKRRMLTIMDAIFGRRSVRAFTKRAVTRETVHALLFAAAQAPYSSRLSAPSFVIVQKRGLIRELTSLVAGNAPETHGGSRTEDVFHGAGTLIIICVPADGTGAIPEVWLAAENILLAAVGMGLGACLVGSAVPGLNTANARRCLGLPDDVVPAVALVVGEPLQNAQSPPHPPPDIVNWL